MKITLIICTNNFRICHDYPIYIVVYSGNLYVTLAKYPEFIRMIYRFCGCETMIVDSNSLYNVMNRTIWSLEERILLRTFYYDCNHVKIYEKCRSLCCHIAADHVCCIDSLCDINVDNGYIDQPICINHYSSDHEHIRCTNRKICPIIGSRIIIDIDKHRINDFYKRIKYILTL